MPGPEIPTLSDGVETHSEPIEELSVDRLKLHPRISAELAKMRGNALNVIRTAAPTDVATIARTQGLLNVIDLLLGNPDVDPPQRSLAEILVNQNKPSPQLAPNRRKFRKL